MKVLLRIASFIYLIAGLFIFTPATTAELLEDINNDGMVAITAFGDSITFGVGDGVAPGSFVEKAPVPPGPTGYPARIQNQLGVLVDNAGSPGELLTGGGVLRFPAAIQRSPSDLVLIMESTNDATFQRPPSAVSRALQQNINVAISLKKLPVLLTVPPPCCNRSGSRPITRQFNKIIREKAVLNELALADVERAWDNTCEGTACELYNLPEGLHPNTRGYTVIAQTVMATLLGIDIFAQDGPRTLESALGLEVGQVLVKPDPTLQ
jgi:lysophospholipase L1-like esterase